MASEWEDSTAVTVIKCIVLIFFILTAVLGNGSVIYAVWKFKQLQTISNYFVFNLAIADVLFALTGMPLIVVTSITKDWVLGDFMCNLCGLFNFLFCSVSIWTLVMISLNRYFAVAKATYFTKIYTTKRTCLIIAGVWLFSFLITMPPLVGWSGYKPGSNTCLLNGKKHKSYAITLVFIDFFLPLILLTVLYSRLFLLLKRQRENLAIHSSQQNYESMDQSSSSTLTIDMKSSTLRSDMEPSRISRISSEDSETVEEQSKVTSEPVVKSFENQNFSMAPPSLQRNTDVKVPSPSTLQIPGKKQTKKKSGGFKKRFSLATSNRIEQRIIKMLLVVVIAFFLSWTPFIIASALYGLGAKPENFRLMTLGIIMACTSSVINPFVYAVMNKNFRETFKIMFRLSKKKI